MPRPDGIAHRLASGAELPTSSRRQAEEPLDGQADVGRLASGFADEDGRDAGGFQPLDVAPGADAALADQDDVGRDLVAEPEGQVEVGDEPLVGRGC